MSLSSIVNLLHVALIVSWQKAKWTGSQ